MLSFEKNNVKRPGTRHPRSQGFTTATATQATRRQHSRTQGSARQRRQPKKPWEREWNDDDTV
jgi:hypothetical protein